jgi:50S ribosomal subunit-associated GTPase HflX
LIPFTYKPPHFLQDARLHSKVARAVENSEKLPVIKVCHLILDIFGRKMER